MPSDRALRALPVLLVLLALAAWEVAVRSGSLSPLFYPPPSAIARALAGLVASGKLAAALGASLSRIFLAPYQHGGRCLKHDPEGTIRTRRESTPGPGDCD